MSFNKPELLAPAGSLEKLKVAFLYGADAVYIGGEEYSLRVAAENFSFSDMREGAEYAHSLGKKVYLTANIIPHNEDMEKFGEYLKKAADCGIDAVIISDLGMFSVTKRVAPNLEIHISTQANNVNFETVKMWKQLGAKRVILARELSLGEISEIYEKVGDEVELEAFIHGAMCISYSGRCLLSNYMTERDSNLGACSHPCRWNYSLMEEKRPGEFFPVYENERGTFIFNSKDLCMIEHIPELVKSGLCSFKIEGRVKSEYYLATVIKAYRAAIDSYFEDKENYSFNPEYLEEIKKVSHRGYTTGFYFKKPGGEEQNYKTSSYIRDYELLGVVEKYDSEEKIAYVVEKNRFFPGDEVEFLCPDKPYEKLKIEKITDIDGNVLEVANRPQRVVKIPVNFPLLPGSMMRGKKK